MDYDLSPRAGPVCFECRLHSRFCFDVGFLVDPLLSQHYFGGLRPRLARAMAGGERVNTLVVLLDDDKPYEVIGKAPRC